MCFAVGVALPIVGLETNLPCNLGGLGKLPTPLHLSKILTLRLLEVHFLAFLDEKSNLSIILFETKDEGLQRVLFIRNSIKVEFRT